MATSREWRRYLAPPRASGGPHKPDRPRREWHSKGHNPYWWCTGCGQWVTGTLAFHRDRCPSLRGDGGAPDEQKES